MVRIEYEYPLFKVYYSNNSNNSNIRGNPALFLSDTQARNVTKSPSCLHHNNAFIMCVFYLGIKGPENHSLVLNEESHGETWIESTKLQNKGSF